VSFPVKLVAERMVLSIMNGAQSVRGPGSLSCAIASGYTSIVVEEVFEQLY